MTLDSICDVINRIETDHPYSVASLLQVCNALKGSLAELESEDLRYGLTGVEKNMWAWDGYLAEYLVPTSWMKRFGMTDFRYTLAEACFFLQQIADIVKAREIPAALDIE